jgi:hypothetical protein
MWNKNVEQQYGLDKGDAKPKTICSQTSENTVDIERAKSLSSGSGDSSQHQISYFLFYILTWYI